MAKRPRQKSRALLHSVLIAAVSVGLCSPLENMAEKELQRHIEALQTAEEKEYRISIMSHDGSVIDIFGIASNEKPEVIRKPYQKGFAIRYHNTSCCCYKEIRYVNDYAVFITEGNYF